VNDHLTLYHRRLVETYGLLIEAIYDCDAIVDSKNPLQRCDGRRWFLTGANGESAYERREHLYGLALTIENWVDNNIDRENQFSDMRAPGLGAWDGDVIPDIWERIWAEDGPQTNYTQWGKVALDYLNSKLERRK